MSNSEKRDSICERFNKIHMYQLVNRNLDRNGLGEKSHSYLVNLIIINPLLSFAS